MQKFVATKLFLIVVFSIFGCDTGHNNGELSSQYQSFDSTIAMSVIKFNHGATVPYVYRVYIHSKNVDPLNIDSDLDVLRIDSNEGLKIAWQNNDSVSISCVKGSIYKFTSIGQVGDQRIRINMNTNC